MQETGSRSSTSLQASSVECTGENPLRVQFTGTKSPRVVASRMQIESSRRSPPFQALVLESAASKYLALPGRIFTGATPPRVPNNHDDSNMTNIKNLTCTIDQQIETCESWHLFPFFEVSLQSGLHGKAEGEPGVLGSVRVYRPSKAHLGNRAASGHDVTGDLENSFNHTPWTREMMKK